MYNTKLPSKFFKVPHSEGKMSTIPLWKRQLMGYKGANASKGIRKAKAIVQKPTE